MFRVVNLPHSVVLFTIIYKLHAVQKKVQALKAPPPGLYIYNNSLWNKEIVIVAFSQQTPAPNLNQQTME